MDCFLVTRRIKVSDMSRIQSTVQWLVGHVRLLISEFDSIRILSSIECRRMDDDRGRQTELRQSAVKTMRGILFAWMQQVDEVPFSSQDFLRSYNMIHIAFQLNTFKNNNLAKHALHARFDLETGLPKVNPSDHVSANSLVYCYISSLFHRVTVIYKWISSLSILSLWFR